VAKIKLRLAEITQKYIGSPYKLNGWSVDEGFDCFSLLYTISTEEYGFKMLTKFDGVNLKNYSREWILDQASARDLFVKYLSEICTEIKPGFNKAGDILLLEGSTNITIGMQIGQDLIMSAFTDIGVALNSLRPYKIIKVFRWVVKQK